MNPGRSEGGTVDNNIEYEITRIADLKLLVQAGGRDTRLIQCTFFKVSRFVDTAQQSYKCRRV